MGSELVKTFEKWGWKMFLLFFGFRHIWGSVLKIWLKDVFAFLRLLPHMGIRTCENFWKKVLKLFFAFFSALVNVNLCEISFLSKKSCRKSFFQILKYLPYKGITTCKNFRKMELKNVFAFFSAFTLYGDQNL